MIPWFMSIAGARAQVLAPTPAAAPSEARPTPADTSAAARPTPEALPTVLGPS